MATAINENLGGRYAQPQDDSTVRMAVPDIFNGRVVELVAQIEPIEITIDTPARVVVNERTGTVVMGADVKVSAVAVAHGSMTIDVTRQTETSQPAPLSRGTTVVTQETQIQVKEEEGRLTMVEGTTIGDLVGALNEMGVKPRDLIEILLTMRAAGALHASVETL
jgi:flagellar P-ring protein precursor FlgI